MKMSVSYVVVGGLHYTYIITNNISLSNIWSKDKHLKWYND